MVEVFINILYFLEMNYLLLFASLGSSLTLLAEKAPESLDWQNYEQVKSYVVGKESENNFLQVNWHKTFQSGQAEAVSSDKPILLWLYFGGPTGRC